MKMIQETKDLVNLDKHEDLESFAEYLGIDYEDLYQLHHKIQNEDIDFDDWSR
jgi:diketogulonate reductase-like aldo/keto reductase